MVCITLAAVVLRAAPRKAANQHFAFFMLLVGGNFIAEFVAIGYHAAAASGADGGLERLFFRVAFQLFLLDPFLLLYFALLYPRRSPLLDRAPIVALLATPALALTTVHVALPGVFWADTATAGITANQALAHFAANLHLAVYYLAALALLTRALVREESALLRNQLSLMVAGFGIAVLPRLGLAFNQLPLNLDSWGVLAYRAGIPLAVFGLLGLFSLRASAPEARPQVRRTFGLIGALLLVVFAMFLLNVLDSGSRPGNEDRTLDDVTTQLVYALRWIFFGVLVGYALLKYQVLDMPTRLQQAARWGAAAMGLAGAALVAWMVASWLGGALRSEHLLALAALAVTAPPAARWSVRLLERRLGQGGGDTALRRVEVYRASLESALRDGALPEPAASDLRDLRRSLGLTEQQHEVLLEVVRAERRGPRHVPGRLAGRYDLKGTLGQGSTGRCRLARDLLLGRNVVVKEVPCVGDSATGLLAEARAAGSINHPNIVTVHDVLEAPGLSYLVMEHAEGGNLRQRMAKGIDLEDARRILDDLLAGLAAAHHRGIVHGDLKPENILLTADGRAKVGDFGSASAGPGVGTLVSLPSHAGPATLAYMAPEQVKGEPSTQATDLYAAAAIAHELLTGSHYLDLRGKGDLEVREAIVRETPRLASPLAPDLRVWLERGLAKDPGRRWPSATAMREAFLKGFGTKHARSPRS
jgi:hypothetical protein